MNRLALVVSFVGALLLPIASAHSGEMAGTLGLDGPWAPNPFSLGSAPANDERFASLAQGKHGAPAAWHAEDDGDFGVEFRCKSGIGGVGQAVVDANACPLVLADLHDALSQPLLVVDPTNDEYQAFSAMHGGRGIHSPLGPQPPSDTSRDNALHQPHTLFRSGGSGWEDWPYYAPEQVAASERTLFGEDNAIAMDRHGNVYLGGILALQDPDDAAYRYQVVVYKEGRINRQPSYLDPTFRSAQTLYGTMSDLHMAYVPATDQVLVMWNERGRDDAQQPLGPAATRILHSSTTGSSQWQELPMAQRFGPCTSLSGFAVHEELAYVACAPAKGYGFDADVTPDRVQVHAVDTRTWTTQHTAQTAAPNGHLTLIARGEEGHMILLASGVDAQGKPFARVSYGVHGQQWTDPDEYGPRLHKTAEAGPQAKLADARITAAVHNDETSTIHVLWSERYQFDPADPSTANTLSLYKTYAVLRPGGGFLGTMDLGFGKTSKAPAVNPIYQGGPGDQIFRDQHDSIVIWREPRLGADKIYVAFGDYGFARWAEVVEVNPPVLIPLPPAAVPAIPLAAATSTGTLATAAIGALTGLMLLRILAARKKARVEAPTL